MRDTFGPFTKLRNLSDDVKVTSYFDDVFARWDHEFSHEQTWDVTGYREVLGRTREALLDIGCGTGRLAFALRGCYGEYIGIDRAAAPLEIFRQRLDGLAGEKVTLLEADVLGDFTCPAPVGTAVLGSVTVNSFATESAVRALLTRLSEVSGPRLRVLVPVFAESVAPKFERFNRIVDVLKHETEAGPCLVWRGMHYEPETRRILHNVFLEQRQTGWPGVLGIHVERLWSPGEITAIAESLGFESADRGPLYVADGGAEGWECRLLVLTR
ncbi:Methyltransferase domain-containing protein [Amycolatopsis xylanica]|uniref:Methyltransferase domain-containing protein n=1 Tax=Amycolatopsis xylanica TaxID=589385 RepID=A0A1H2SFF3_9PSEU|nr:class I SAM-dependent methyltransferase [Amycolatopsis xylanica]SDW30366.1 Methyltransferase domain-containing protein [Amycolatopsis xylanica]